MATYNLVLPKMGESIIEATIITWHKKVGDIISENETILEVATDKVDSDVPSPVSGIVKEILFKNDDVVAIGETLAIIDVRDESGDVRDESGESGESGEMRDEIEEMREEIEEMREEKIEYRDESIEMKDKKIDLPEPEINAIEKTIEIAKETTQLLTNKSNKYFSPLVLNIASVENISMQELEKIAGTGLDNRVTKEDMLAYVELRSSQFTDKSSLSTVNRQPLLDNSSSLTVNREQPTVSREPLIFNNNTEIIEMDRMRKLISKHMTDSKKTAAHVSSFVECDVTNIVKWREKIKTNFAKRENYNFSFMPIFIEAIAKAIRDFPMINISVDGDTIIKKRDINIGIATALPNGNLIVPVLKNADQKSLLGIANDLNILIQKARTNTLQPDDISGGTYTLSNIGTFGNIIGTPIINLPQVAIMAVGSITKKPVVIEVDGQDVIAIRSMMYLSHTYDHRVVDGMLGGMFVKKVSDYLEQFDVNREI